MTHKSQLFLLRCPIKWSSILSRLGAGGYKVLKGHFSRAALLDLWSVNNKLQEIPILESWPFLFVWMNVRWPLTLICLNVLTMTMRSQTGSQLTLIMLTAGGNHHLRWVYFLFPASGLGKKKKLSTTVSSCSASSNRELYLSPRVVWER